MDVTAQSWYSVSIMQARLQMQPVRCIGMHLPILVQFMQVVMSCPFLVSLSVMVLVVSLSMQY